MNYYPSESHFYLSVWIAPKIGYDSENPSFFRVFLKITLQRVTLTLHRPFFKKIHPFSKKITLFSSKNWKKFQLFGYFYPILGSEHPCELPKSGKNIQQSFMDKPFRVYLRIIPSIRISSPVHKSPPRVSQSIVSISLVLQLLKFYNKNLCDLFYLKMTKRGKPPGLVVNVEDSRSKPWSLDVGLNPRIA